MFLFFLSKTSKKFTDGRRAYLERAGDDVKKIFGFLKRNDADTVVQK